LGNTGEERALVLILAFEVLDALAEVVLGLLELRVLLSEFVIE
jgi:hypothetical protein